MPDDYRSDEQQPTAAPEQGRGRAAVRDALRARPSRAQLVVGVLLFVVGFGAATQVRSNEQDDEYGSLRQADLIRVFDALAASSERAENEIDRLTATREDLLDESSSREAALQVAQQETAQLAILAGTVPVAGPGITITITNDVGRVTADTILDLIQELRASGAEAMEFNDRIRVVAQTAIAQTSAGITLDGQLIEAPYVIDVIGEPATMEGSLDFRGGPIDQVEKDQGTISSEVQEQVVIESVVDPPDPEFAEPRDEQ